MTNLLSYDEQLAIETYWKDVGGLKFLPGTARSADRFARISWNLNAAPKEKDPRLATATTFSLIRAISAPLGIADPERPNIASTEWYGYRFNREALTISYPLIIQQSFDKYSKAYFSFLRQSAKVRSIKKTYAFWGGFG